MEYVIIWDIDIFRLETERMEIQIRPNLEQRKNLNQSNPLIKIYD
jgi:hypothetical protein